MTASVDVAVLTEQERAALATRRLCEALGVGTLKPKDLKHLSVALTEAAIDEVGSHPEFAERVLRIFHELAKPSVPKPAAKKGASRPAKPKLEPIGHVDPALLGPDRPLDPYVLQQLYGNAQLRPALDGRSMTALKQAVSIVQQRHPDTSPANRTQKAALIDYIVQYVTG
ncbi:MAG: hypothetical protein ACXVDA_14105 [Ktedonobacterales bacterium]